MLTLTQAAREYLCTLLQRAEAPAKSTVRIFVQRDHFAMAVEQEREGDEMIELDGESMLALDARAAEALSDRMLDVEPDSRRLVVH